MSSESIFPLFPMSLTRFLEYSACVAMLWLNFSMIRTMIRSRKKDKDQGKDQNKGGQGDGI